MADQSVQEPVKKIEKAAHQTARAESAAPQVRRYRVILFQGALIVIASAFAILTVLVKSTPSFALDLQISRAVQLDQSPLFAGVMYGISWPGFSPQSFVITGLIVLAIYLFGFHWEAVMAVVAVGLSSVIDLGIKNLIDRPRPAANLVDVFAPISGFSFPSGHVMYYCCFFGFVGFLLFSLLKPSVTRTLLLALVGLLVILIGLSRVYLGQHWPSDVLGAYLLGSLTLVAIILIYRWGKPRYFVHQPVAPSDGKE
jgi:membrane-associated phospholipid phosphatase